MTVTRTDEIIGPWIATTSDALSPNLTDEHIEKSVLENAAHLQKSLATELTEKIKYVVANIKKGKEVKIPGDFDKFLETPLDSIEKVKAFLAVIKNYSYKSHENPDPIRDVILSTLKNHDSQISAIEKLLFYQQDFVDKANRIRKEILSRFALSQIQIPPIFANILITPFATRADYSHFVRQVKQFAINDEFRFIKKESIERFEKMVLVQGILDSALKLQNKIQIWLKSNSSTRLAPLLDNGLRDEIDLYAFINNIKPHLHEQKYESLFDSEFIYDFKNLNEDYILCKNNQDLFAEAVNLQSDARSACLQFGAHLAANDLNQTINGQKSLLNLLNELNTKLGDFKKDLYGRIINAPDKALSENQRNEVNKNRHAYSVISLLQKKSQEALEEILILSADNLRENMLACYQALPVKTSLFNSVDEKALKKLKDLKVIFQKPIEHAHEIKTLMNACNEIFNEKGQNEQLLNKFKECASDFNQINYSYSQYNTVFEEQAKRTYILYRHLLAEAEEMTLFEEMNQRDLSSYEDKIAYIKNYFRHHIKKEDENQDLIADLNLHENVKRIKGGIQLEPQKQIVELRNEIKKIQEKKIEEFILQDLNLIEKSNFSQKDLIRHFIQKLFLSNLSSAFYLNDLFYEEKKVLVLWNLSTLGLKEDELNEMDFCADLFGADLKEIFSNYVPNLSTQDIDANLENLADNLVVAIDEKNKNNPGLNRAVNKKSDIHLSLNSELIDHFIPLEEGNENNSRRSKNNTMNSDTEYHPLLASHDAKIIFKKYLNRLLVKLNKIDEVQDKVKKNEPFHYTDFTKEPLIAYKQVDAIGYQFPNEKELDEQEWDNLIELIRFTEATLNKIVPRFAPQRDVIPAKVSSPISSHVDLNSKEPVGNAGAPADAGQTPSKSNKLATLGRTLAYVGAGLVLAAAATTIVIFTYGAALPFLTWIGASALSALTLTGTVSPTIAGIGLAGIALTVPMTSIAYGIFKAGKKLFGSSTKKTTAITTPKDLDVSQICSPGAAQRDFGTYHAYQARGVHDPLHPHTVHEEPIITSEIKQDGEMEQVTEKVITSEEIDEESKEDSSSLHKKF